MRTTKSTLKIGIVLLLVCLAPATAVAGQSQQANRKAATTQQANYSVSVTLAGTVATGEQTLAVTVDNTGSTDLLNPVIEVPLDGRLNATAADANTAVASVDGTNQSIDAEINTSTITSGDALFLFGRSVPAGKQRTYYVDVEVTAAGSVSVDAEVRPLYNSDVSVTATTTAQARGYGNLTVEVRQPDNSLATSATISVGGSTYTGGTTNRLRTLEGNYTVSVSDVSGLVSTFRNVSLDVQEDKTVTFTVLGSTASPAVAATTADARVIPPSVGQTDTAATASRSGENQTQYTVESDSGSSIITEAIPADLRPLRDLQITTGNNGQVVSTDRANGLVNYTLSATGNTDVTVTFKGYKLGDATLDNTVTTDDAGAVASELASRNTSGVPQYADVNDDGNVTVVDAMYVAQYANGVRDSGYNMGGGT